MFFFLIIRGIDSIKTVPLIQDITIQNNEITIKAHKFFQARYLKEDFFVRYNREDVDVTTLSKSVIIMPFLMNVLPLIWLSHEIWEIDELDENLFKSLHVLKKLCVYLYPHATWNGMLHVHKLVPNVIESPQSNAFAMPFSGGLDSIHTSISHADQHQILITVKEHHGFVHDFQWLRAEKNAKTFAQYYGHENVFVDSNYQRFIKKTNIFDTTPGFSAATSHGLGWVGIATPVLIAKKCTHLKIASSITYDYPKPHFLCPMIDNSIKCANIVVRHDGFNYTRPDKMDSVAELFKNNNLPYKIYVCQKNYNGTNCCACEKCIRTICALIVLGETSFNKYGFDISFKKAKKLVKKTALTWRLTTYWRLKALQKKVREKKLHETSSFLNWLTELKIENKTSYFNYHHFDTFLSELMQAEPGEVPDVFMV